MLGNDPDSPEENIPPIEVIVKNATKKASNPYDSHDCEEYDELGITTEQIEEFENGNP